MRLPLPFLLYVTALGLFGWAGWTVYDSLPLWKLETRNAASTRGRDDAVKLLTQGKGKGPISADWNFGPTTTDWWSQIKRVNLIGALPKVVEQAPQVDPAIEQKRQLEQTPLTDILELVSLVYDGLNDGQGPNTHVIVRYRSTVAVEPPEWWLRENTAPASAAGAVQPNDLVGGRRSSGVRTTRATRGGQAPPAQPPTAMPTSLAGREILQKVWLTEDGDPRRSARLWPPFDNIRLTGVSYDAQVAYFARELPPEKEGDPAPEPRTEDLFKTTMNLSQDVLKELRRLQGREDERGGPPTAAAPEQQNTWREVEDTTRFGNQFHIGRKDERRFRESADDLFESVSVDTYVSRTSNLRGLSVRSVEPELATRFGVATGDVLLEVNSRKVESKGQAVNQVKKDYNRGVRTFTTKWLSNGQVVERVYQAPDK